MSTNLDTARARLRAADPTDPVDPHDASARAMFERIITDSSEPVRVRSRSPRRRLLLAGAAVAAVAAVATAGVVTTPGSHGHPANGAFAVTPQADGSIKLIVRWDQLRDPAALNAELARLHARTVVVRESVECTTSVAVDATSQHPWITYDAGFQPSTGTVFTNSSGIPNAVFTIRPDKIRAGDTLLIPYEFAGFPATKTHPGALVYGSLLVATVPQCVATPDPRPGH
jgi:hypothetical protein